MTRLRLGLSHLREHRINCNFQICSNLLCSCGIHIESSPQFFLYCPLFDDKGITLLSILSKIVCKLIETNKSSETLLFDNSLLDLEKNSVNLDAFIDYVLSTERFE